MSNQNIGQRIKKLRLKQKKRLKDISQSTGLSISYLSQVERATCFVSIFSLEKIASALGVKISHLLDDQDNSSDYVMRNYQQESIYVNKATHYYKRLSHHQEDYILEPNLITVLPYNPANPTTANRHKGEEFIYILEGVLTVILDGTTYLLNPGDCMHYKSTLLHDWQNHTSKLVRMIYVNTPRAWDDTLNI
jgi:transcriptional regulator with XRE-family HTH domain